MDESSNEKIWSTVCHTKYTGKKIKSNSMLKMIADDTCNTIDSSMNPITKSRVKLITTAVRFKFNVDWNLNCLNEL